MVWMFVERNWLLSLVASGVQITQGWGKQAESLVVFQRTPNQALPMQQQALSAHDQGELKAWLPTIVQDREHYFEQFNRPNVDILNLREPGHGIAAIRPKGIELDNGAIYPVGVIAFATGFDSNTGSLTSIPNLRNTSGTTLVEEWEDGARTYLGMTRKGYPNMFFTYGAQAPGALSSGPSSIEIQGR
ncbi:hypothetical protein BDV12DRAFT_192555 [Aspergillus spectabilis]